MAVALAVVVLAAVAGCGADGTVEASGTSTTAMTTTAPSSGTSDDTSPTTSDGKITTSTRPADPCQPRGYVDREGDPLPSDVDRPVIDTRGITRPPRRVYATESLVLGGGWGDPRPFDWDADGTPDEVVMDVDGGTVSVVAASGTVTVTGVRTDFRDEDHYSSIHSAMPLDVGDVTGDGNLDLLIASRGSVAVLVGRGAASAPLTVAFDRIGVDAAGWVTPPWQEAQEEAPYPTGWPSRTAEPVLFDDVDGDGIDDIGVYLHASRASGPFMLLLGQPCPAA